MVLYDGLGNVFFVLGVDVHGGQFMFPIHCPLFWLIGLGCFEAVWTIKPHKTTQHISTYIHVIKEQMTRTRKDKNKRQATKPATRYPNQ